MLLENLYSVQHMEEIVEEHVKEEQVEEPVVKFEQQE